MLSEILQVVALALVVIGVTLFSVPLGFVAAGAALYWVGEAL